MGNLFEKVSTTIKIINLVICMVILSLLAAFSIKNYSKFNGIINDISDTSNSSRSIALDIKSTAESIRDTSKVIKEVAELQKQELTDPQAIRSRRLLYQSGDNIYRLILKGDHLLDHLESKTLNKVDNTVDTLNKTIGHVDQDLQQITKVFLGFIEAHRDLAVKLQVVLDNPNIPIIMENIAKTLNSTDILIKDSTITVDDFNKALPDLLRFLTSTSENISNSTGKVTDILEEARKFANQVNQKDPKYIRALKFILQIGANAAITRL